LAILAAGAGLRQGLANLAQGQAVYHDLTNAMLAGRGHAVPIISPADAGRNLARIAMRHDLTLFEYFMSDFAGHSRDREEAAAVLAAVDECLSGLLKEADLDTTLIVLTSDHGNIEDLGTAGHTKNPVPVLFIGCGRQAAEGRVAAITDIAPLLEDLWLARVAQERLLAAKAAAE
jgi:bisphosphoglycerate-independent phosphoglycerate mutase (AlkP superfamily)